MDRFRAALKEEVRRRLKGKRGAPSHLTSGERRSRAVEFALAALVLLWGVCARGGYEDIAEHATSGLMEALCNAQPQLYPRSR